MVTLRSVLKEQAGIVPKLEGIPRIYGDWMLLSDPHFPFHCTRTVLLMVRDAKLLGIKNLCIPGDLIHADRISKYDNAGKTVPIVDELVAAGKILRALLDWFDDIQIIVGNHDQRIEKLIAKMAKAGDSNVLSLLAHTVGSKSDPESISYGILQHFFGGNGITIHPLPEIIINDHWRIQHPSTCSRTPPKIQKDMAHKHHQSVVGGHNHLWGLGFDNSGKYVAYNIGPSCDDSSWRYIREKPSSFPRGVQGWGAIMIDKASPPEGRLIALADHDRYFDLEILANRMKRVKY